MDPNVPLSPEPEDPSLEPDLTPITEAEYDAQQPPIEEPGVLEEPDFDRSQMPEEGDLEALFEAAGLEGKDYEDAMDEALGAIEEAKGEYLPRTPEEVWVRVEGIPEKIASSKMTNDQWEDMRNQKPEDVKLTREQWQRVKEQPVSNQGWLDKVTKKGREKIPVPDALWGDIANFLGQFKSPGKYFVKQSEAGKYDNLHRGFGYLTEAMHKAGIPIYNQWGEGPLGPDAGIDEMDIAYSLNRLSPTFSPRQNLKNELQGRQLAEMPETGPPQVGAKNAETRRVMRWLGKDEMPSPDKQTFKEWMDDAIRLKMHERAQSIADDILKKKRFATERETAALTYRQMELVNQHDEQLAISEDRNSTDAEKHDARVAMGKIDEDLERVLMSLQVSGSPIGRALAARKLMVNRDYSVAAVTARASTKKKLARDGSGRGLTAEEKANLKERSDEYRAAEKAEREAEVDKWVAQADAMVSGRKKRKGKAVPAGKEKIDALTKKARELLRAGCGLG